MGGINSGNYRDDKKGLVEHCMVLASAELMPNGRAQRRGVQTYHWINPLTGEKRGSINCEVSVPWDGPASVRFKYRVGPPPGEALDYTVSLADAPAGGLRRFLCPVQRNGAVCGRRVLKLYLPPGGQYFGCRVCHNLTYRCSQTRRER